MQNVPVSVKLKAFQRPRPEADVRVTKLNHVSSSSNTEEKLLKLIFCSCHKCFLCALIASVSASLHPHTSWMGPYRQSVWLLYVVLCPGRRFFFFFFLRSQTGKSAVQTFGEAIRAKATHCCSSECTQHTDDIIISLSVKTVKIQIWLILFFI